MPRSHLEPSHAMFITKTKLEITRQSYIGNNNTNTIYQMQANEESISTDPNEGTRLIYWTYDKFQLNPLKTECPAQVQRWLLLLEQYKIQQIINFWQ